MSDNAQYFDVNTIELIKTGKRSGTGRVDTLSRLVEHTDKPLAYVPCQAAEELCHRLEDGCVRRFIGNA